MHEGITLFTAVWLMAFASTVARAIRDGDRSGWLRCAGLGCTAGFLAVGVVGVCVDRGPNGVASAGFWFWVAVASLIGGLGKEQDQIRILVWNALIQTIKSVDTSDKK